MNMNKALQNLYHAVSGSTTTKVNISKLLVDIHYAITGVESSVKNNWSRIIDSMATNWPEGGGVTIEALSVTENDIYTAPEGKAYSPVTVNVSGGSSDFSTAEVTVIVNSSAEEVNIAMPFLVEADGDYPASLFSYAPYSGEMTVNSALYKGCCTASVFLSETQTISTSGSATVSGVYVDITGNCTITISDK